VRRGALAEGIAASPPSRIRALANQLTRACNGDPASKRVRAERPKKGRISVSSATLERRSRPKEPAQVTNAMKGDDEGSESLPAEEICTGPWCDGAAARGHSFPPGSPVLPAAVDGCRPPSPHSPLGTASAHLSLVVVVETICGSFLHGFPLSRKCDQILRSRFSNAVASGDI
jgi:hypothetical protein